MALTETHFCSTIYLLNLRKQQYKSACWCTPRLLISYIFPAKGGECLLVTGKLLNPWINICDPGDLVMSDKGIRLYYLFAFKDVHVTISTFFKKRPFVELNCFKKQIFFSKRVHIERLIKLAKTLKILKRRSILYKISKWNFRCILKCAMF